MPNTVLYPLDTVLGTSQVGLVVKNLPANAGDIRDLGSILGSGNSPGRGHGNPLPCSCLGNPMDRGAWWARGVWWATVHSVTKSLTWLKRLRTHTCIHTLCCPPNNHMRKVALLSPLYRGGNWKVEKKRWCWNLDHGILDTYCIHKTVPQDFVMIHEVVPTLDSI